MSTFDGIVKEFPTIRIDNFTYHPDRPSPLACFLSHVHSDHLRGLASLRSPFVYCSAATKEILLNIERYADRINFSKCIVESRKKTFKHLRTVLRPIPLGVPTIIELKPQEKIRVTLFDANHCPGSAMFLIEGDGKSILYTGDVRAEHWWIGSLIRHPVLIPYAHGKRVIDSIYLDTTFAVARNIFRTFPSKAEGIRELIEKVEKYPSDTVFYLRVRTFGYEDVWQALASALNTQVHVDNYQWNLFCGLRKRAVVASGGIEGPSLCGFTLGHDHSPGCLTHRLDDAPRIHSCYPPCPAIAGKPYVVLTPIVNREETSGREVPEVGLGGGQDDLFQTHELVLADASLRECLKQRCLEQFKDSTLREKVLQTITRGHGLNTLQPSNDDVDDASESPLAELLVKLAHEPEGFDFDYSRTSRDAYGDQLSGLIKFPFSRHSSYDELCNLVKAFRPRDIIPCTVDHERWSEEVSMGKLFGHLCSGKTFCHDKFMKECLSRKRQLTQSEEEQSAKRLRVDENSSFAPSAEQIVNLASSTPPSLELIQVPSSQDAPTASLLAPSAVPSSPDVDDVDVSTQESSGTAAGKGIKCVKQKLRRMSDNHQLKFSVITSSYPDSNTPYNTVVPATTTSRPVLSFAVPDAAHMSFACSQPFIPSSFPGTVQSSNEDSDDSDDSGEGDTDGTSGLIKLTSNSQQGGSQDKPASSSQDAISLSTDNFESQRTNCSAESVTSCAGSNRIKARKEAYLAARAGTYEDWTSVYSGPYEEEVEL